MHPSISKDIHAKALLLVMTLCGLSACNDKEELADRGENIADRVLEVSGVSQTGCKSDAGSRGDCSPLSFYGVTDYRVEDGAYLRIEHHDIYFSCDAGTLQSSAAIENGVIVIDEKGMDNNTNCVCPYDWSYRVGPLNKGKYDIVIKKDSWNYLNFSIQID